MVGVAGVEPAPDRPPMADFVRDGRPGDGSVATSVATDSVGDAEEPPIPERLAAALGVLRRLRNDMGLLVFGSDSELVERLLDGGGAS